MASAPLTSDPLVDGAPGAALWNALNHLETSYWFDVDQQGGSRAHEFYVADGLFAVGENRFAGHDRIRAFYEWRRRRGPMTTRHLINNLQVVSVDAHHARVMAVLSLYRANGRPPIQGARPPCLIADVTGDCVRGEDQVWRYRSHVLQPIFVGSDIPLSMSIDTQVLEEQRHVSAGHAT